MSCNRRELLSIGAFSRATMLSRKALRLYQQYGILQPKCVDPESGYRYYSQEQLQKARLVRLMRQIDMPLITIRQILDSEPRFGAELVVNYQRELEAHLDQVRRMIQPLIAQLHSEVHEMEFDVSIQEIPEQLILSIRERVFVHQLDQHIRDSLKRMREYVAELSGITTGAPFGIYHGPINYDDDGPIEVCLPVKGNFVSQSDIAVYKLPGGRMVGVTARGSQCHFPAILGAYDTAYDWVSQHGYETAGPPREVWLNKSGEPDEMQILWPFRERRA